MLNNQKSAYALVKMPSDDHKTSDEKTYSTSYEKFSYLYSPFYMSSSSSSSTVPPVLAGAACRFVLIAISNL